MDTDQIQKYLSIMMKFLFSMLGLIILLAIFDMEYNKKPPEEIAKIIAQQRSKYAIFNKGKKVNINKNLPYTWPPKMNEEYPDIDLFDQEGVEFKLSDLKGKVIIIEYIDMTSPISQAQSGAGLLGAYNASKNQDVDKYAMPISDILRKETNGAVKLPNDDIAQLKIIIYGENTGASSRDDATNWAKHFNLNKSDNVIVAVPKNDMRAKESQEIITGFQLIDKNMILRVDSAGVMPKHNLKLTLVPLVPKLLQ